MLIVKSRLGINPDRHERAMPKSKATWVNIIAIRCKKLASTNPHGQGLADTCSAALRTYCDPPLPSDIKLRDVELRDLSSVEAIRDVL
jgi:hypothetical protein